MLHFVRWIYGLTVLVILTAGCSREIKDKPDDTVIRGTIRFNHGAKIYLYGFTDSLSRYLGKKAPLDTAAIDEDGNFRFVLHPSGAKIYLYGFTDSLSRYLGKKAPLD